MTRSEVEASYEIRDGRIASPGKFEGEAIYVPALWSDDYGGWMDCPDHKDCTRVAITAADKIEFPELRRRKVVHLHERDDGFVVEL